MSGNGLYCNQCATTARSLRTERELTNHRVTTKERHEEIMTHLRQISDELARIGGLLAPKKRGR